MKSENFSEQTSTAKKTKYREAKTDVSRFLSEEKIK